MCVFPTTHVWYPPARSCSTNDGVPGGSWCRLVKQPVFMP